MTTHVKWFSISINYFILHFHRTEGEFSNSTLLQHSSHKKAAKLHYEIGLFILIGRMLQSVTWLCSQLRGNTASSPVTLNQIWNTGCSCYINPQGLQLQINPDSWQKSEWSVEGNSLVSSLYSLWSSPVAPQSDALWKAECFCFLSHLHLKTFINIFFNVKQIICKHWCVHA